MVSQGLAAGRFPLYTDADVYGPLVKALIDRDWDVVRAVDIHPEKTKDLIHFQEAARRDRVLVSNDRDMRILAIQWSREGRAYRGLIWWPRRHYKRMSTGDFINEFGRLAGLEDPFHAGPIIHIKPTQ